MKDNYIELTDGSRLTVNINFATLYYINKSKVDKIVNRKRNKNKELSDDDSMEAAARIIHAILKSNGKNVTFDEALQLVPADTDSLEKLFSDFEEKLNNYKKKEEAKQKMKNVSK